MIRKAFVMSVHAGAEDEYRLRHNPIWPDLLAVLKSHGVSNYSIFLDPMSRRLVAYVEIDSEERWEAIAKTQECQKWWRHMAYLMPHHPDHSPVADPLVEIFHLP